MNSIMNTQSERLRCSAGFSFVEVMVVVFLLLILVAVSARFISDVESREEMELRKAREGIMLLKSALGARSLDLEKRPPLTKNGGLEVLVKDGYLDAVPKDPWGSTYQYSSPAEYSGRSYDLYSLGPDREVSDDDIADWNLYGEVYRGTSRKARKRDRALNQYDTRDQE